MVSHSEVPSSVFFIFFFEGARLFIKVAYSRSAPMDFNFPLHNALDTTFPVH